MRIAVAGKGGAGKTTIAATLARILARRGYHVSALDDDPNPNLAIALGVPRERVATLDRLPEEASRNAATRAANVRSTWLVRLPTCSAHTASAAQTGLACCA